MWVNTESRSIALDGELRDDWDLERDTEEPRDNVLPVKSKKMFASYFNRNTVCDLNHFIILPLCSRLTPGAAQCGLGQTSSSPGLCEGQKQTILLILAPKQPPPLVPLERPATYSAQVIFTSGGHHGQWAYTVPLVVQLVLGNLCELKQKTRD